MRLLILFRSLLIVICLLFSKEVLLGQVRSCTQVLTDASFKYSEGVLDFIEEVPFKKCFTNYETSAYSDEEKIQARKLVVNVHIYEDRIPEAEEAMIQLLHDDPEHPIDEALDPYEFVYLYNKFRTKPIYRWGVKGGVTYSTMDVIDEFGVEDLNDDFGSSFSGEIGVTIGGYIDYNFWNKFEISLGVNWTQNSVSFDNDLYQQFGLTADDQFYSTTLYKDVYNFIDVPLVLKYNFDISPKFIIYPYAGITGKYLFSAKRSGRREVVTPPEVTLTELGDNRISARKTLNYTYNAGIGFKLRSNTNYFTLELGAQKGGNNFVDTDGRYQSDDLLFRLGQVDGNMGLDYLSVMLGYQISMYNPKKLKQFRDK